MDKTLLGLLVVVVLATATERASAYGFGGFTRAGSGGAYSGGGSPGLFAGSQPMMPDAMNRTTDSMGRPAASASRTFVYPPQGGASYQPAPSRNLMFPPDGGFGGT